MTPGWALKQSCLITYIKKRGASPVTRSTYLGLRIALSVETSNAESPTPM